MGVDFDARESYDNLAELLKIESRNRRPAPQPQKDESDEQTSPEPLSVEERQELKRLERMCRKGRKIDQPTPEEMIKLGRLRERAKL